MNKQDILPLYKYNQWANGRILDAARSVTQEQFLADAYFPHGGLRSTLTHILFAEWIWRNRGEGISPTVRFKPEEFPTLDALLQRWQARLEPLSGRLFQALYLTRNIPTSITQAGFRIMQMKDGYLAEFPNSLSYCWWGTAMQA